MGNEIGRCEHCGAIRKSNVYHNKKWLCRKHYDQFRKHKKFLDDCSINKSDANDYVICDDCVHLILRDKFNSEVGRAIIDREDFQMCIKHKWYKDSCGYARTTIDGVKIRLHKFLTNTDSQTIVDHINRNRLDCRKCNLRTCSSSLNSLNRNKQKNNTSTITGVDYHVVYEPTDLGYWYARYTNSELDLKLSRPFKRKADAIKQRKIWEEQYGGAT